MRHTLARHHHHHHNNNSHFTVFVNIKNMSYICDTECIYYFTFLGQFSVESASDYIVQLSASFCMDISLYCFYSRLSFQKNFFSINRSSSCCEVNSRRFFPCCFKSYWILLFFIFFFSSKDWNSDKDGAKWNHFLHTKM